MIAVNGALLKIACIGPNCETKTKVIVVTISKVIALCLCDEFLRKARKESAIPIAATTPRYGLAPLFPGVQKLKRMLFHVTGVE